jgi:hypothetical protein
MNYALILPFVILPSLAFAQDVATATGGTVRWLDKISGVTKDVEMTVGETQTHGRLSITLDDCRYPVNDPASNAFAHLTISDSQEQQPVFMGWMIATSPALSSMDHARYDVWILRCKTPAAVTE